MPNFNYSAMDKAGKISKGKMEAKTKELAFQMLKDNDLYPMEVLEENRLNADITFGSGVSTRDLTIFCQQFESVLKAGISVLEALYLLQEQTENKRFQKIIGELYNDVEQGEALSSAMIKHPKVFPNILVNMIQAGEVSGNLEVALNRMAIHFKKEYEMGQNVKKATTYPIVVAIIAMGVVVLLLMLVVPTFVEMFDQLGTELPATTRMLLGASNFMTQRWYIVLLVIAVAVTTYILYARSDGGKLLLNEVKLKLPVFGPVNTKIVASRFTRTLSTLLASGLPLLEALDVVSKVVDNPFVEQGLLHTKEQVSKGVPLSKPINDMGIFPPMVTHMVRIGEDTGQLEPILNNVADFYDTEVETAVSQLTTMLEPTIIVFLAVVVGFVVISIIQPMFGVYNSI